MASQVMHDTFWPKHVKLLTDFIRHLKQTPSRIIVLHKLDLSSTRIVCYSDSSFTNNNHSTHLGYCILLVDKTARTSWLHYCSYNSKRVVCSVLWGGDLRFRRRVGLAYTLSYDVSCMPSRPLELIMLIDSLSLFKFLLNASTTTEKRLMIDIRAAREAYEKIEIRHVGWVRSEDNLANGVKKPGKCQALEDVLTTVGLTPKVMKLIERTAPASLTTDSAKDKTPEGMHSPEQKKP